MADTHIKGLYALTRGILENIPPSQKFRDVDENILMKAGAALLALENDLVQGFYDTVQNHPPMAAILAGGVRSERETTLRRWWQRTLWKGRLMSSIGLGRRWSVCSMCGSG